VRAALGWSVLVLVVVTGIELALQAIALVAVDRRTPWRPGAIHRVLCVGGAHTYGAGVRAEEAYPAQLQEVLDARAPGAYSVINRTGRGRRHPSRRGAAVTAIDVDGARGARIERANGVRGVRSTYRA
jgi:hypothetical protein